ncbi:MAG: hypothetical protein JXQ69_00960 [Paludibacteraceae bacterium]|nr:hypothetical protein [Paludibacteraceae bacterium]
MKFKFLILAVLLVSVFSGYAQDKNSNIERKLNSLITDIPALDNAIDISVDNVTIQDFVRAVAQNAAVNINIDPSVKMNVANDFTQVKIKDILLFLCKEYSLDIEVIGNIISLKKVETPIEIKKEVFIAKVPFIEYDKSKDLLSIDVFNDTLRVVAKIIADKTGKNIVIAPGLSGNIVNAYIKNMPFESVLEKLTFANNLSIEKTNDNYYLIKKSEENPVNSEVNSKGKKGNTKKVLDNIESDFDYKINKNTLSIHAERVDLYDVIKTISSKMEVNYMLLSDIQGLTTIHSDSLDYEHFLVKVLDGTSYNYMKDGNIYLIGEAKNTSLISTEIYDLQFRSVDKIKEYIPADFTRDVKIIEFAENNSLVMTGNMIGITKLKDFLRQIDKVVPVILIEVTILDVTNSYKFSTGLTAGLSNSSTTAPPSSSGGSVFPSIDVNLSTKAINSVVNGINGLGLIKLGNVSSNFYASLKLMEDNGVVKIKSTPKLSTLNGHDASLSSGETRYYKEVRNDYIGTLNPTMTNSYSWKPLNADLSISIKPIVSGDGQITMEIQVQQSEFTGRASADNDSPYNSVKRDFKSSIRVKDQEVILLGGLERNKSENSGTGVPFLSRIPVVKWFFSNRVKSKENSKFTIFIKPIVIY